MLEITKVQDNDIESLKRHNIILNKDNDPLDNCFVLKENGNIRGFGYYDVHGTTAQIRQLEIIGQDIDLIFNIYSDIYMDFIIRGLINSAEHKGLEKIYLEINKVHNPSILTQLHFDVDSVSGNAILNIEDFFNSNCRK